MLNYYRDMSADINFGVLDDGGQLEVSLLGTLALLRVCSCQAAHFSTLGDLSPCTYPSVAIEHSNGSTGSARSVWSIAGPFVRDMRRIASVYVRAT